MTTRIAFLRSIEIQQTAPYLADLAERFEREGITAKVFLTHGGCGPADFPGEAQLIDPATTPEELVRLLLEWAPDAVVSLSIPDENALRDAVVKEELARHGVPMVMHGLEAVRQLSNKWETKQLLEDHGLATPASALLDGDLLNGRNLAVPAYRDVVRHQARALGYPLISKPLWDCLGNGMEVLRGGADLNAYLDRPYDGNLMLERFVGGELCSVEVLGAPGRYVVQPVLWMGPAGDGPVFTFGRLRYAAPRPEADAAFAPVADRLVELCEALGVHGAVDLDMIYADGVYHVLEVNPRVSGATTLSIAASELNTYDCLVSMALGQWPHGLPEDAGRLRRVALQFPVEALPAEFVADVAREVHLVRAATYHIGDVVLPNLVITCDPARTAELLQVLEGLDARHGCLDRTLLDQLAALLDPAPAEPVPAGR